jgi:hypothetical protein
MRLPFNNEVDEAVFRKKERGKGKQVKGNRKKWAVAVLSFQI